MPLQLGQVSRQIEAMAREQKAEERQRHLRLARELLRSLDPAAIRARLADKATQTPWTAAKPLGALNGAFPTPAAPADFSVAAADGSSMGPDRHFPIRYYVLNVGYAMLTYGSQPAARLDSRGRLYHRGEEVYISYRHRTQPVEGAILSAKMIVEELKALLEVAQAAPRPVVALTDGVIILWGLQGVDAEVRAEFLSPFLETLGRFREAGIPVADYISLPNAHDVVNALRLGVCDQRPIECARCAHHAEGKEPVCAPLVGIPDRQVFDYLKAGERSDLFESTAPILKNYGEHGIGFFYLNVGDEMARVEAPLWVLNDRAQLDLVHALVVDQCRRGRGYPPALQEAHEQAVITTGDRAVVEEMIDKALGRQGVILPWSAKERSKRERGI